jgi:hypothetical protein
MGYPLTVSGPALPRIDYRHPSEWLQIGIAREFAFRPAFRFMVSIFATDRLGLLEAALAALSGPRNSSSMGKRIRLSVDGSLSSAVHGTYTMSFIVRVIPQDNSPMVFDEVAKYLDDEVIPGLIKDLEGHAGEPTSSGRPKETNSGDGPSVRTFCSPFTALPDSLFSGRHFAEYRFVASSRAPSPRYQLAGMASALAEALGSREVPITHLYFPDDGGEEDDLNASSLVVGFAPTEDLATSISLDLEANHLAAAHDLKFTKLVAVGSFEEQPRRSVLIADYRIAPDVRHEALSDPSELQDIAMTHVPHRDLGGAPRGEIADLVLARFVAKPGLVASMLSDRRLGDESSSKADGGLVSLSECLLGGSMTVLAGQTIACWVVEPGQGASLCERVNDLRESTTSRQPWSSSNVAGFAGEAILVSNVRVRPASEQSTSKTPLWMAWSWPDRPGIFSTIVSSLRARLIELDPAAEPDFRFTISRVVQQSELCVGKVKFTVPSAVASQVEQMVGDITDLVRGALCEGEPDVISDSTSQLLLGFDEPLGQPWGSLTVV